MKLFLVSWLLLFSYFYVEACGNSYYEVTLLDGKTHESEYGVHSLIYPLTQRFNIAKLNIEKRQAAFALKAYPGDYKHLSDFALVLLKLGETDSALSILRKLYKNHPQEYNILANLGTAYELANKPDSALLILQKALQVNPDSHQGSEWIHLKILEAKIAKWDDAYLHSHSIIGFKIKNLKNFYEYYHKQPQSFQDSIKRIKDQLYWQLDERTAFVEPSDKYVASLLLDLANLEAVTESVEYSLPIYELAMVYDPYDDLEIRGAYGKLLPLRKKLVPRESGGAFNTFMNYLLGFSLLLVPIIFFVVILVIIKKKIATRHAK